MSVIVEDRRDERGRWLPGVHPPCGSQPVIIDEVRETAIEMLRLGVRVDDVAQALGVSHMSIWRALAARDADNQPLDGALLAAHRAGQEIRRVRVSEGVADMLDLAVLAGLRDAETGTARERKDSMLSVAIGLDAHAKAAGLAGPGGINVAVQVNIPAVQPAESWRLTGD